MAEFQEVMRQWNRMCEGTVCKDCKIELHCASDPCSRDKEELQLIEQTVMSWAAEHPEPVYPTWGEWFLRTCQVPVTGDGKNNWEAVYMSHIPADIAQKLGIEPKEG